MAIKITALMIAVNQEDWIWWSLKSVYPAVDHIVIVEGVARDKWCFPDAGKFFTLDGKSTDRTEEEIRRFMAEDDPDKKVEFFRVGFQPTIMCLRNFTLEYCPRDTDYVLVVDSDHLYDEKQLHDLRLQCEARPGIRAARAEHLMFLWDMHHILMVDEVHVARLQPTSFFFKYSPQVWYARDRSFYDHILQPRDWKSAGEILSPPPFQFWHFGWMGPESKVETHLLKDSWSRILRAKWLLEHNPESLKGSNRKFGVWARRRDSSTEELLAFHHTRHKLWTGTFNRSVGEHLELYEGHYPLEGLIEQHPYWSKTKEEFGWGGV